MSIETPPGGNRGSTAVVLFPPLPPLILADFEAEEPAVPLLFGALVIDPDDGEAPAEALGFAL